MICSCTGRGAGTARGSRARPASATEAGRARVVPRWWPTCRFTVVRDGPLRRFSASLTLPNSPGRCGTATLRPGSVGVRGSSPLSSTPKVQVRALITDQGPDCCSAPSAMRPQRGTGSRRDDRSIPGLSDLRFRLSGVFRKRSEGPMRIAAQPVPGPDDGARQGSCRTRRPTSG